MEVIENEQWVSHSNDVLTFRMVETPEEWEKAQTRQQEGFKPDFTHQVFSDEEEIKGYKDLSIDVFINARDFTTLVKVWKAMARNRQHRGRESYRSDGSVMVCR